MGYSFTRRQFLTNASNWAAGSLFLGGAKNAFAELADLSSPSPQNTVLSRKAHTPSQWPIDSNGMIVYSEEYITREMPITLLDNWITPAEHFFVRNNEHMPQINAADWSLSIAGEVARPLTLSMAELLKMESRKVTNTLECAGNGRAFFEPRIGAIPWSRGAVGNADFRGPSLAVLLRQAGLKQGARHVAFRGAALETRDIRFTRSIPIEKALDPDTIVATEMNGSPLTSEHGYPARALVPGWIGSASIKWLTEVRVLKQELQGYFMDSAYRLPAPPTQAAKQNGGVSAEPGRGTVITSLPIKSIIATPVDGSAIYSGPPVRVFGAAWAGESSVARVEVSTDSGKSWQPAVLRPEHARYAWRLWDFDWKPANEGSYAILSRATDVRGLSQPFDARWNPGGYLWNAVDRVRVSVGRSSR
jgi:DMSO/TMAO reductase YedYZ molybdopterin-dependent catalytic subunit